MDSRVDAVVVGAGFAGLYALHKLRALGLSVVCIEAGDDVGGTWYWNRYPGARCDVESMDYSYSWSDELQREWRWTERYPSQPEILRYLQHVADRFDLRGLIRFGTRVTHCDFMEKTSRWSVRTDSGDTLSARFVVMATGCLSVPRVPDLDGIDAYLGATYHTGRWPHERVDFSERVVGVVGTGSSAIQAIPLIAAEAQHVYVFQRTPNFSVPAHNGPLDRERERWIDENFARYKAAARRTGFGGSSAVNLAVAASDRADRRRAVFEERWQMGGVAYLFAYSDVLTDESANELASEFVRDKIRQIVKDPGVAESLLPRSYPIGAKRLCVDTGYFETFNQSNVELVDLRRDPLIEATPTGVRTQGRSFDLDIIVFATGFDAMTGALLGIEIKGRHGDVLRDKWSSGPSTYLGIMTSGFPNLFMITGPQSPSVLSNMVISIEQHVDWVADLLAHMEASGYSQVDATVEAETSWGDHVQEVAARTLFLRAESWYTGANVPGKPCTFMPYAGGVATYRDRCDEVAAHGYEGFELSSPSRQI